MTTYAKERESGYKPTATMDGKLAYSSITKAGGDEPGVNEEIIVRSIPNNLLEWNKDIVERAEEDLVSANSLENSPTTRFFIDVEFERVLPLLLMMVDDVALKSSASSVRNVTPDSTDYVSSCLTVSSGRRPDSFVT